VPESTITSKGQITIPVEVRRRLGLSTGSRIRFVLTETGSYEIVPVIRSVRSLKGLISPPAVPISIDDMNKAVADAAAGLELP
jgi:antitoxin PrlF